MDNASANNIAQRELSLLDAWLASASPDEWHAVALGWNWDRGVGPLRWMVDQPACDGGTAQFVFWQCRPQDFVGGAIDRDIADLTGTIARNSAGGSYHKQIYNVADHVEIAPELAGREIRPGLFVDSSLCRIAGSKPDADSDLRYNEGIPASLTLKAFEDCGEEPPAWLKQQLGLKPSAPKSLFAKAMDGELSEADIETFAADPDACGGFESFRKIYDQYVREKHSNEIGRQKALGNDAASKSALDASLAVIQRGLAPYDPARYRDLENLMARTRPPSARSSFWSKLFGK